MDVLDVMIRVLQVIGVLLFVGGLAYHFAALEIFNFLVPKDAGTTLVASRVSYGPDERQRFDLYRPNGAAANLPVLIFVHGGGWDSGRGEPYEFLARAFAAQGYLTATITYRIGPKNLFPDFVVDAASAIRKVQDSAVEHGGDATRIFLVGHSAGGNIILQSVLDPRYFDAAHVDLKSIKAIATLAAPADFYPFDAKKSVAAFGKHPHPEETQPINYARSDAPPLLLMHGSIDTTVRPPNSRNLFQKLKLLGAPVELKEYPGVGHVEIMLALSKPRRSRLPVLADILNFFNRYK